MIAQVKDLLKEKNVTAAVVVDDAYDIFPKADDLAAARWNSFFDDISDEDERELQGLLGKLYDDLSVPELAANDLFVRTLWENRNQIAPSGTIFAVYEERQKQKRAVLAPLLTLLGNEFGLTCKTVGRDATLDEMQAQIVFLDLYLGFVQRKDAITKAGDKLRKLIHANPADPPSVILLSESSELHDLAPVLRDDAEVLGCQFRWIDKDHLSNQDLVSEKIYDLVISHGDAVTLNQFVLAWSSALDRSKNLFMKSIRSLDLADYANVKALILESEGEPLGDYLLDIYDLHLHSLLEGDVDLAAAAKKLTTIDWANNYPPAQFIPSDQLNAIMDGALFHNQVRTDSYIEGNAVRTPRFGEVFLAPEPAGQATSAQNVLEPYGRACGLVQHSTEASIAKKEVDVAEADPANVSAIPAAHDPQVEPVPVPAPVEKSIGQATNSENVLEPDGNASGLIQHSVEASIEEKQVDVAEANPVTVPAIPAAHDSRAEPVPVPAAVEKSRRHAYIVLSQACDLQHCETDRLLVLRGDVSKYRWNQHDRKVQTRTPIMRLDGDELSIDWDTATPETWLLSSLPEQMEKGFRRARTFRMPFALQIQQAFIGRLGRVGTLAALPTRYAAKVRIFMKTNKDAAALLVEATREQNEAVCLVGRTHDNVLIEWLLLSPKIKQQLREKLRAVELTDFPRETPSLATLRSDPGFLRALSKGLKLNRGDQGAKGSSRPFKDTPFDVVQILTNATITAGKSIKSYRGLVIEVDFGDAN